MRITLFTVVAAALSMVVAIEAASTERPEATPAAPTTLASVTSQTPDEKEPQLDLTGANELLKQEEQTTPASAGGASPGLGGGGDEEGDPNGQATIQIEPSEFATSQDDREYDEHFDYGNEAGLKVGTSEDSSKKQAANPAPMSKKGSFVRWCKSKLCFSS